MAEEFNYPYRRFSSDFYANVLVSLLEENEVPYEIVSEPEGAGSIFLGSAAIPGVILMLRSEDVAKVNALEKKEIPDSIPKQSVEPEAIAFSWLAGGYIMILIFPPIAIIFGYMLMKTRKRYPDLTYQFSYDQQTRNHGRVIFVGGIVFLVATIGLLTSLYTNLLSRF